MKFFIALFLFVVGVSAVAQVPYVSAPTNTPSDMQTIQRTGNRNKWVPFPSGGGDATNFFLIAGSNSVVITNAQFTFTLNSTTDTNVVNILGTNLLTQNQLWLTNAADGTITNRNKDLGVTASGILTVTNSIDSFIQVLGSNSAKWVLKAVVDTNSTGKAWVYSDAKGEHFVVTRDGNLSKIKDISYTWPSTNLSSGQVFASDGNTPQLIYGTNLPAPGITGGTTNVVTTNTPAGVTNFVNSQVTNQIPNFIHGRSNYVAFFNPNTNEVSASIMFQTNGTTDVAMRNGDSPDGSAALRFIMYGHYVSEAARDWLEMNWNVGNGDYEILTQKGSGGTTRRLAFGTGGTLYWDIATSGHLLPINNNTTDIGAPSDGIRTLYCENLINLEQNGSAGTMQIGNFSQAVPCGFNFQGARVGVVDQFNTVDAFRFECETVTPPGRRFFDLGTGLIGTGSAAGSPTSWMGQDSAHTANLWMFTTNNGSALMGATATLSGAQGNGTDTSGGDIVIAGGRTSGAATNGSVHIRTAQKGVSGSQLSTNAERVTIAAEAVTLTTNSAQLVYQFTVPTSLKHADLLIFASTTIDNGTDLATISEWFGLNCLNKAGTVTTGLTASSPTNFLATGSATLTNTWTATVSSQTVSLNVKAVTGGIAATTATCELQVFMNSNDGARVITTIPN